MDESPAAAAPDSGTPDTPARPTFEELVADPEIAALLDFEPVPRKRIVEGGWTPELQRKFIARLAVTGSAGRVCDEMGKDHTGMMKVYRSPLAASFRAAWDGAVAIAKRRQAETAEVEFVTPGTKPPTLDHRRKFPSPPAGEGERAPGEVMNELGEWEDEASLHARADDARHSVSAKLLRSRRLYLMEISGHAAKRAAFEILTQYPVDWDKAAQGEPQDDEPWRPPSMRKPDMLLTAENGWLGDAVFGPDKQAELMRAINDWRAEQGLEEIGWSEE